MSSTSRNPRVAVVLSGWPRLSEVFALNELTALHEAGMLAAVLALKNGETGPLHPAAAWLDARVDHVPAGSLDAQAAYVAQRAAAAGATGVHGYFAHRPTAVAAGAAGRLGLPYGFSVHALDARKVDRDELAERVRRAAVVVCCNPETAQEVQGPVQLVRHGVDLAAFPAAPPRPPSERVRLLAVGRFVPKKGLDVLLDALVRMPGPVDLRLVGDGALRPALIAQVERLGIADRVEFVGRLTHAELPQAYAAADVVVVPSVVDAQGDRDGLPNVVLEAMASARPVVASAVAAIPTAVRDGSTGLLVAPGDAAALARALTALVDAPLRRAGMGAAGRAVVEREFELGRCTSRFVGTLAAAYA